MNILVIAHQLPYPPDTGGKIRHYQLYSRLAQRHSITWVSPIVADDETFINDVLTFCDQVIPLPMGGTVQLPTTGWRNLLMRAVAHLHWERLFEFCFGYVHASGMMWMTATPQHHAVINQTMLSSRFDVVICETIGAVELMPQTGQVPKVISLFDIQSVLFRRLREISPMTIQDRLFYLPELVKIRRYEARHYGGFDAAITVSERDKSLLAHICPYLAVGVVHNGVDIDYFQPDSEAETGSCLVFVGHYGYPPNSDAAYHFCRQILPKIHAVIEDVTFLAVGRDAPADLGIYPGVKVIGTVSDVRPYLRQASVVVAPVRAGSGTRIKILEAMAMGKAVVSTSLGAEGLDVVHRQHIMLADTPDEFAEAVIRLLVNPTQRLRLGTEARRLVTDSYEWGRQADRLDAFIDGQIKDSVRTMLQP